MGTTLAKYYSVPGLPTALNVGGTFSYLASDSLSSVSESLDSNGNVTAQQLYTPYGSVRYNSGTMPTSKGLPASEAMRQRGWTTTTPGTMTPHSASLPAPIAWPMALIATGMSRATQSRTRIRRGIWCAPVEVVVAPHYTTILAAAAAEVVVGHIRFNSNPLNASVALVIWGEL